MPAQWALVLPNADVKIRRGCWYRILRLGALEVTIEVNRRAVPVRRSLLQIEQAPVSREIVDLAGHRTRTGGSIGRLQAAVAVGETAGHGVEHPGLHLDGGLGDDDPADHTGGREPDGHLQRPMRGVDADELQAADT